MANEWIVNGGREARPEGVYRGTLVDAKYRDGVVLIGITAGIGSSVEGFQVKERILNAHGQGGHRTAFSWCITEHFGRDSDIIEWRFHLLIPPITTRKEARDFCREHPEYSVIDNGKDAEVRWSVSKTALLVKEI